MCVLLLFFLSFAKGHVMLGGGGGGLLNPLECVGIVKSLLSDKTEKTSEGKVILGESEN